MSKDLLASLYRHHRAYVRGSLQRLGVASDRLDDAAHDVFVVLIRRIADYDSRHSHRRWLWGIARKVAWAYRKHQRRQPRLAIEALDGQGPADVDATEARLVLDRFFADLDGEMLLAFVLSEVRGCTAREVAAATGVPLTTAQWRIRAARIRLRRAIEHDRALWAWFLVPGRPAVAMGHAAVVSTTILVTPPLPSPPPSRVAVATALPQPPSPPKGEPTMTKTTAVLAVASLLVASPALAAKPSSRTAKSAKTAKKAKAPAKASGQDADEAAYQGQAGADRIYKFDEDPVVGEKLSPEGVNLHGKITRKHKSMITLRGHFNPELIHLTRDM